MALADLLTRPCVVWTPAVVDVDAAARDAYNNPAPGEPTVTETVCELQQRQRTEDTGPGQITADTWLLVVPAGVEISTASTVTVDGEAGEFELAGEPWQVRNPRTGERSHIEATLRRATAPGDVAAGS